MKRFLHAGEGYVPNSLTYKLLSPFKRYIQTSSPNKFGWLAYPSWVPKVTGMYFLVALLSSMLQHGSRFTRILLVFSLSPTRTAVEADSNNSRRSVEQVSKKLAKNPLKIQKPIYSALAGFFFSQLHYVSHDCLSALKPRYKRMWARALCVCLSVFFLYAQVGAAKEADRGGEGQFLAPFQTDSIKLLQVGDTIPDHLWDLPLGVVNHPEGIKEIRLSDYKGKLIILDFWSTWCSPCIAAFPEMQSLQERFEDDVQIILVNQSERDEQVFERMNMLMNRNEQIRLPNLPMLNGADFFRQYFEVNSVPHHIWIGEDREIEAITFGDNTNENNIAEYLQVGNVALELKEDPQRIDYANPYWLFEHSMNMDNQFTYFYITGHIANIYPSGSRIYRDKEERVMGLKAINKSILDLYKIAYGRHSESEAMNPFYSSSRIALEVSDSSCFIIPQTPFAYREWMRQHTYSVEINLDSNYLIDPYERLKQELGNRFSYAVEIEIRSTPCWVLRKTDQYTGQIEQSQRDMIQRPYVMRDRTLDQFLSYFLIRYKQDQSLPIVADQVSEELLTMVVDTNDEDLISVSKTIEKQGFSLVQETVNIPILVIRDLIEEGILK